MFIVIYTLSVLPLVVTQEWNFAGVNIAQGRNATQMPDSPEGFSAGLAVDNDTSSCSETGVSYQDDANWTVTLDREYRLKGIRIYNRENYEYRLANFSIVGGPRSAMLFLDQAQSMYNDSIIEIRIISNETFSEITIQIPAHTGWPDDGNSTLSLCEVEIYSVLNDCTLNSIPDNITWEIRSGTGFNNTEYVSSGSELDVSCPSGSTLRGASNVTCLSDGTYSEDVIGCFVACSTPPSITNGEYMNQGGDYVAGDYIHWNCSTGYSSSDINPRQCLSNESWSGQDPTCSLISCSFPVSVTNGNLTFTNGTEYSSGEVIYGTLVNVTCDEGFRPLASNIECNTTGYWDNNPGCLQIECVSLGIVTGGIYEYSRNGVVFPDGDVHVYGTEAELFCNESLYRAPSDMAVSRECGGDGDWTGRDEMCIALCQLPDIQDGSYRIGGMAANETVYDVNVDVIPVCNTGYKLNDSNLINQTRTCQSDHTWSGEEPFCIRVTCTIPVVPINGSLQQDGSDVNQGVVFYGDIINVVCHEGFEQNTPNITCQENGSWDSQAMCIQIRCQVLGSLSGGDYEYMLNGVNISNSNAADFAYGTIVTATCNEMMFRLNGDGKRVCEQDRSWTGKTIYCTPRCLTPPLENGRYDNSNGTEQYHDRGVSISPVCNEGYELNQQTQTGQSRTCQVDHTWTGPEPDCNIIMCSVSTLQTSQNFYDFTDSAHDVQYDKEVTTACLEGYERQSGNTVRKCLSSKIFSGEELICTEIKSNVATAVGATVAVLVVVVIIAVLAYFIYFRKKQSHDTVDPVNIRMTYSKRDGVDSVTARSFSMVIEPQNGISHQESGVLTAVANTTTFKPAEQSRPKSFMDMNTLADFVLTANFDSKDIEDEFMNLKQGLQKSHDAASSNPTKNRFDNVLAYDETRVKLEVWDAETDTDYINANYIAGYTDPHAYIACQGPSEETFSDFWRMVWQQDCEIIVMLTNLREGAKVQCGQYWPSEGGATYGKVTVTLKNEASFAHFVIRTFSVGKMGDPDREVLQYHFTTWPEDKCPEVCMRVLNFCNKANDKESIIQGPMVVHCSNGAGRTGTFIAIDYLTEQSLEEGTVVVVDCVKSMRELRSDMVESKEQYVFIHRALVETFLLNTFDVSSDDFPEVYASMLSTNPIKGKSNIDVEYDNLQRIAVKAPTGDLKHVEKNRNPNNIPAIEFMPSIEKPGVTSGGDDYINAVFVPTYRRQNGFIIAESPLESTKDAFWKLVYHQKVTTIVMMNSVSALDEKETYWPQKDESVTLGELEITHKSVTETSGHSVLSLSLKRADEVRDITLIQFGTWQPGNLIPAEHKDMLSAIKLAALTQTEANTAPVLVHCMDGAEMTGLFCVISIVLERENIEESVAVPQVIQEVQSRRAQIIPNVEQFRFCYEVVVEHMKSKNTSSFKI